MTEPPDGREAVAWPGGSWAWFRWYYAVAIVVILALLILAQAFYTSGPLGAGSLLGTVTDPEDHVLPGMTVRLTGLGETQERTSDEHGQFTFTSLDPGTYRIEAWGRGYPLEVYEPVVILQARATHIQVQLRLAVRETSEPADPEPADPEPAELEASDRTEPPVARPE